MSQIQSSYTVASRCCCSEWLKALCAPYLWMVVPLQQNQMVVFWIQVIIYSVSTTIFWSLRKWKHSEELGFFWLDHNCRAIVKDSDRLNNPNSTIGQQNATWLDWSFPIGCFSFKMNWHIEVESHSKKSDSWNPSTVLVFNLCAWWFCQTML